MEMKLATLRILSALLLLLSLVATAYAALTPTGPDTIVIRDLGRHGNSSNQTTGANVVAQAGNITELVFTQVRSTQAWQGYVGNVSGTITLDDGNNNTLFDWRLNTPSGEVYASNGTPINWASIYCINFSSNITDGDAYNLSKLNQGFGINSTDLDSFNNTFNSSFAGNFRVGTVQIDGTQNCSQANMYVDQAYQSTDFIEVLLTDNQSVIFTALLENDINGYRTGTDTWDFQMIVAQNGHPGFETTTTNYFFFLELN